MTKADGEEAASSGGQGQSIVIRKVKRGSHGGHHGGAWKLAYADFVTAMMAFFLLMWLLATATKEQKQGVAGYFNDPSKAAMKGGSGSGDRTAAINGGGEDIRRDAGHGKASDAEDAARLGELEHELEALAQSDPALQELKNQLRVEITDDGLRILIFDKEGTAMFSSASAQMEQRVQKILRAMAPLINRLPNRVSISGHTDARPFPGGAAGYSNWELSADRANAARRELVAAGLREDKLLRVVGMASSVPLLRDAPLDPTNRRISITVMNRKAEDAVLGRTAAPAAAPTAAPARQPATTPRAPAPQAPAPKGH